MMRLRPAAHCDTPLLSPCRTSNSGLQLWVCVTCGVQYAKAKPAEPPEYVSCSHQHASNCLTHMPPCSHCPVCEDVRQYVGLSGQKWTTRAELQQQGHSNPVKKLDQGVLQVGPTQPKFAIGQRAHLVQAAGKNILWDCLTHLDDTTIADIKAQGGVQAIAISHPHFYDAMLDWGEAFDCKIYLHEADREWVLREDVANRVVHWSGDSHELAPGAVIHRLGGHFPGSCVLHVQQDGGDGFICTGDTIQVTPDLMVSFLYSYPNLLPLPASEVERIAQGIAALPPFSRIYGIIHSVSSNAQAVVQRSAERYLAALRGDFHRTVKA